ncbi:MAG: polysaccharide deacetylase family protein [Acidothermaceae bacterium]
MTTFGRIVGTAVSAQIVPAATWLPAVRRFFPELSGVGRADHVALTFDDGPDPESTPAYLNLLSGFGATATFFLVGQRVRDSPELVRRIVDEGHEVAVHGWRHRYLFVHSPQLGRCIDAVGEVAGVRPAWFRPPYGVLTATALAEANRHGLRTVLWTRWAKDWAADSTAESVHGLLAPGIVGGATLLLHDAGSSRSSDSWRSTLQALPRVLRECADSGLRVGTLAGHGVSPAAGPAIRSPYAATVSERGASGDGD